MVVCNLKGRTADICGQSLERLLLIQVVKSLVDAVSQLTNADCGHICQ